MPKSPIYSADPVKQRIFNSYRGIRQCVYNPNNPFYKRSRRAGLELDCHWDHFEEFYEYVLGHLGPPPWPGARVLRKNQNKDWAPGNLEWNTHQKQAERHRNCVKVKYQGKNLNLKQWSDLLGINPQTIYARWSRGHRKPKELFKKERL